MERRRRKLFCRKCNRPTAKLRRISSLPLLYARCGGCGRITFVDEPPSTLERLLTRVKPQLRSTMGVTLWVALAGWVVWADYLNAFDLSFPVTYILPILFAANSGHKRTALVLAVTLPLARSGLGWSHASMFAQDPLASGLIQSFVLALLAVLIDRQTSELRALRTFLPICSSCRRIESAPYSWEPLEAYARRHARIDFTPQVCPECHSVGSAKLVTAPNRPGIG